MTFIIKRVPFGKIFAVRRSEEGQDLGIKRDGGTGEVSTFTCRLFQLASLRSRCNHKHLKLFRVFWQIVDVEPFGLAARHGLTAKTQVRDGTNLCNWFLTEINSRPVNLFYKGDEVSIKASAEN